MGWCLFIISDWGRLFYHNTRSSSHEKMRLIFGAHENGKLHLYSLFSNGTFITYETPVHIFVYFWSYYSVLCACLHISTARLYLLRFIVDFISARTSFCSLLFVRVYLAKLLIFYVNFRIISSGPSQWSH